MSKFEAVHIFTVNGKTVATSIHDFGIHPGNTISVCNQRYYVVSLVKELPNKLLDTVANAKSGQPYLSTDCMVYRYDLLELENGNKIRRR